MPCSKALKQATEFNWRPLSLRGNFFCNLPCSSDICNAISNVVAACRIVHKFTWLKFNSCCHPHACMLSLKRWIIGNFMKYMLVANRTWSFFMLPLHRRIGNKQKRSLESQPFKLMSLCTRDGLYQLFKSIR